MPVVRYNRSPHRVLNSGYLFVLREIIELLRNWVCAVIALQVLPHDNHLAIHETTNLITLNSRTISILSAIRIIMDAILPPLILSFPTPTNNSIKRNNTENS